MLKYNRLLIKRQPLTFPNSYTGTTTVTKYVMLFIPTNYETVFLSYDEPNCESNYQRLLELCPTAKRVHGIKGSDTAHKKVAELCNGDRVNIIDGDNYVRADFFINKYEIDDFTNKVVSFSTRNHINGLQYGNGSIKSWPVNLLKEMHTHEDADSKNTLVDFDFGNYLQVNTLGSCVINNGSPLQAWRAGFREGVKLCMRNGSVVSSLEEIDWRNFDRLWNWMHIGSDVNNGLWAMHGARFGCWHALLNFDLKNLHNFDYLDKMFYELTVSDSKFKDRLETECNRIGQLIRVRTNDRRIKNVYSNEDSKTYKEQVKPILRCPDNNPYDIVFISYNELNADKNYELLLTRFPRAKRIHGIKGIHNAHIEAAKLCDTDYFWVVDGDAEIVDDFKFDYVVPFYDDLCTRVWRAKNPVNDLVYGYGGVKLLPRTATVRMNTDRPDMTTSICKNYEPIMVVSNITRFNTDPFNTWRSAFRECTKLSSQIIPGQIDDETNNRLDIWCTTGDDRYAIDGAIRGRIYGKQHRHNINMLLKINDFVWMKEQYDRFH
jgi:hypothetical protein